MTTEFSASAAALQKAKADHRRTCAAIGAKLRALRLSKDLSLVDVASLTGVSPMSVCNLEKGSQLFKDEAQVKALFAALES